MPDVRYEASAPYFQAGEYSEPCRGHWWVFHGYGQLAEPFLDKFRWLTDHQQVVVAPQGPDRFYYERFRKVGASWTTRLGRDQHLRNQQAYLAAVAADVQSAELPSDLPAHYLGFSQGVSVVTRWLVQQQPSFRSLVLWAGGFPEELGPEDWHFVPADARVLVVVGDQDEYLDDARRVAERERVLRNLPMAEFVAFAGKHEMPPEVIRKVITPLLD